MNSWERRQRREWVVVVVVMDWNMDGCLDAILGLQPSEWIPVMFRRNGVHPRQRFWQSVMLTMVMMIMMVMMVMMAAKRRVEAGPDFETHDD